MTCIATDGKTIAADSRSTVGDLICTDEASKLIKGKDGSILGCAGDHGACQLVRDWFSRGANFDELPRVKRGPDGESAFVALILRPDGSVEGLDDHFAVMPRSVPSAIGSGGQVALGAMLAGKSPGDAIRLTSGHVTSVGGRVDERKAGAAS